MHVLPRLLALPIVGTLWCTNLTAFSVFVPCCLYDAFQNSSPRHNAEVFALKLTKLRSSNNNRDGVESSSQQRRYGAQNDNSNISEENSFEDFFLQAYEIDYTVKGDAKFVFNILESANEKFEQNRKYNDFDDYLANVSFVPGKKAWYNDYRKVHPDSTFSDMQARFDHAKRVALKNLERQKKESTKGVESKSAENTSSSAQAESPYSSSAIEHLHRIVNSRRRRRRKSVEENVTEAGAVVVATNSRARVGFVRKLKKVFEAEFFRIPIDLILELSHFYKLFIRLLLHKGLPYLASAHNLYPNNALFQKCPPVNVFDVVCEELAHIFGIYYKTNPDGSVTDAQQQDNILTIMMLVYMVQITFRWRIFAPSAKKYFRTHSVFLT